LLIGVDYRRWIEICGGGPDMRDNTRRETNRSMMQAISS
jgi:hypothetical protein